MVHALSDGDLVANTRRLATDERRITGEILSHINEVERRRLYAGLGFPSLFEWLTKDLKYSAPAAYRRIQAARLLATVPEAVVKVESGELNLTTLARVQTAIRNEEKRSGEKVSVSEKREIVSAIELASSREADAVLIKQFPQSAGLEFKADKVRSVGEQVRVDVTMTKAQFKKIERIRELASHALPGSSIAEAIEFLADEFLRRRDPLMKRPREAIGRPRETVKRESFGDELVRDESTGSESAAPNSMSRGETAAEAMRVIEIGKKQKIEKQKNMRRAISKTQRDLVLRRGNGQCEFEGVKTKRKCGSRYFVEVDHIVPVALGGGNEPENLRLLCRTHNLLMARRVLGVSPEVQRRR